METLAPFEAWSGPRRPKMLLVGEAWGESESAVAKPFVGTSGQELWRMLGEAMPDAEPELHASASAAFRHGPSWISERERWLEATGIAITTVFTLHPPANNLDHLCVSKKELLDGLQSLQLSFDARTQLGTPLKTQPKHLHLRPEFLPELERLSREISLSRPNIVVALGGTASWAMLCATNIGAIRGTVAASVGRSYTSATSPAEAEPRGGRAAGENQAGLPATEFASQSPSSDESPGPSTSTKVLPTYHPAGVMRNWAWRPIVIADLMKAFREASFPEIRRPQREVIVNPTLEELANWADCALANAHLLACDIETANRQITCVGFASSSARAIVVPFGGLEYLTGSYWPSAQAERAAWEQVQRLLESLIPKVGQNFLYDLQYLTRIGIRPQACVEDTMLLHHSLHPEMLKSLGFLGSIYSNEASWKLMRRRKAEEKGDKKDE